MKTKIFLLFLAVIGCHGTEVTYPTTPFVAANDTFVVAGSGSPSGTATAGQVKLGGGNIWSGAKAATGMGQCLIYDETGASGSYIGLLKRGSSAPGNLALPAGAAEIVSYKANLGIYTFGGAYPLSLGVNNTEAMLISATGNVSIKTTTDAINSTSGSFTTAGGGSFAKNLYVGGFAAFTANAGNNASGCLFGISGDTNNRLGIYNSGTLLWGPGNAAGDTTLYRSGTASLRTDGSFTSGGALVAKGTVSTGIPSSVSLAFSSGAGFLDPVDATGSAYALMFHRAANSIFQGSAPTSVNAGEVRIGGGRVMVGGILSAQEIKVTTTGADYVFDDGYRLRPLAEVEQFVAANKHLPGMMPAKAMQADGMPVAEVVTKQLAKIEELTLYAIQAQKDRDAAKAETRDQVAKLEARIQRLEALIQRQALPVSP